ncbi:MAG: hypothetical protein WB997_10970, partial [Candidatus Acidiferrales bacterium]
MPKRVIDFDAMWASDKIAACAEWAQVEYAWLYGLADCCGCFELTNMRVIWGRVAAVRKNLSLERLAQVFDEFHDKGLLFRWSDGGKRYGHWTGSDVPGRLPPPSWRNRLERLTPPVPKAELDAYVAAFRKFGARGEAGATGTDSGVSAHRSFSTSPPTNGGDSAQDENVLFIRADENRPGGLKVSLEVAQAQGLDLGLDLESEKQVCESASPICAEEEKAKVISVVEIQKQIPAEESKALEPAGESGTATPGCAPLTFSAEQQNRTAKSRAYPACPAGRRQAGGGATHSECTPEALAETWEQERGSLPELLAMTPERLARCRERLRNATSRGGNGKCTNAGKEAGDTNGANRDAVVSFLDDFREAVRRAAATPFLCGAGPAGWRANFDWIIANDTNYLKILEGRYDSGAGAGAHDASRAASGNSDVEAGVAPPGAARHAG